ncbi:SusC/RagA family TonB-linked outer membrane protein [Flavobacterium sp. HSC-61S13]|uniref:SusC/RagA family TonB-linked outer membrane protein n=1 Tax=Flavobacterium sp. HSC-61S13 TaxID=2910963 RepID=UPI00209FC067|nr:SusC/RagA family TonB-linked outer membrane protein [Flavobacterium sp. HSC-61S13]MCP1994881.1 TonB-linked SusC/RagA family outer membrane protein [Flavobacterium sp. HSC-61S13]
MKSKFKWILTLLVMAFSVQLSVAQEKTLTGVVSESGFPLPGVSVVIKGTQTGTQTDLDGKYSIKAKQGDVLVFSFIGQKDVTKAVGASNVVNVSMVEDAAVLEEVMIVGYGTATKQSFTGSASQVDSKRIESKNVSNAVQALAGEAAGVRIITETGQPGAEPTVRIRGFGSVNGNRSPLYVVDGVPFFGSVSSINPADIESMSVLKDASATAIYGSRGANGVVLINTKTGRGQDSYIEVETKTGINWRNLARYDVIESPEEYIGYAWESLRNEGQYFRGMDRQAANTFAGQNLFNARYAISPAYNMWNVANGSELIDPTTGKVLPGVTRKYSPENWGDAAFKSSRRMEANLKMGGSSENTSYFTSLGYLKDEGYSINSDYERISARLNLVHKPKDWLEAKMNFGYAHSVSNNAGQSEDSGSIFWFTDNIPSIYPLYTRDANGNRISEPHYGGYLFDYGTQQRGFGALTNAVADATFGKDRNTKDEINANTSFTVNIADGLTFETSIGGQYYNNTRDLLGNRFYGSSTSQGGSIYKTKTEVFTYNFLKMLRYKKAFGAHGFEAMVAHENNYYERRVMTAGQYDLADPRSTELNNGAMMTPASGWKDQNAIESFFGQVKYDYAGKYFVDFVARRDGSSKFKNEKWGNFASIGAAWLISKEGFMENQNVFSHLKVKASYGTTGDQTSFVSIDGLNVQAFHPGENLWEISNYGGSLAIYENKVGNPDLTWEKSKMFQTGIEMGLGKYLDISVDYYLKNTDDLIFDRRVGPSVGFALMTVNDGSLRNEGVEFNVTGHLLKTKDAFIDLTFNGETMKNKMTKMPIDPTTGKQKPIDIDGNFGRAVGHSIGDFYMREWAGVDPETGVGQWYTYTYKDASGTVTNVTSMHDFLSENPEMEGQLTKEKTANYGQATQVFVGKSAIPKVRGAFMLNGGYRGWELSVQMLYSLGGYAYDGAYARLMNNDAAGGNNWHSDIQGRWQNPGDITDVPRLSNERDPNVSSASTRFLTKSDYLSINNIRLGYNVPSNFIKQMGLAELSFFVSGDNLALFTKRDGFNPAGNEFGTSDMYQYTPLSTITGGVKVKF